MKKFQVIIVLFFGYLLSGCATIISKTSYLVYIHSEPKGANVEITDKRNRIVHTGITPTSVTLKSGAGYFTKAEYYVTLTLPGYKEKTVPVKFELNGWYFGNVIFGGLVGLLIVDPLTGAMWRIRDPLVDETMIRTPATTQIHPQLRIIDINSLPPDYADRLEKLQ